MSKIYLVGAGPGRADLLTVRAARVLEQADVVLYDRLVSDEVLDLIPASVERVYVGKEEGEQESTQGRILELFNFYAERFDSVVRLKGGDPFVFGRGAEEWAWLVDRGWEVEVVPGISSSLAVPAMAGVPPTFRGVATGFAVLTGHLREGARESWARYAGVETLVILMGVKNRAVIAQALLDAGRRAEEPVCFIENGTTPRERVTVAELGEVAAGRVAIHTPAVFVVGEVVRVRQRLMPLVEEALATPL